MKSNPHTYLQPRVRVYRTWYEATMPLREKDEQKWSQFYDTVIGYALGSLNEPSFEDSELNELWGITNIKPYDAVTDQPGWIKMWKRKRRI